MCIYPSNGRVLRVVEEPKFSERDHKAQCGVSILLSLEGCVPVGRPGS